MVMWFNVPQARNFLLQNGFVYTLRPKPYRLRSKKKRGIDVLMFNRVEKRGEVYFEFIKVVDDPEELKPLVKYSGFKTLEEWLRKAGENRCLFKVILLDEWDKEHLDFEGD